jgi:hypothetical protein
MKTIGIIAVVIAIAAGCSRTDKAGSGLAWTPDGYDQLSPACKKALACCEAAEAAKTRSMTAADYNEHCSGPATGGWNDGECTADAKSRASAFGNKPVPDACK